MDGNKNSNLPVIKIEHYSDDITNLENEPDNEDQYAAGIDLLNACREFYVSRLETVTRVKKQYQSSCTVQQEGGVKSLCQRSAEELSSSEIIDQTNFSKLKCPKCVILFKKYSTKKDTYTSDKRMDIDNTMSVLRYEMASLIEQDLIIMKKLLQLNEKIEQFKWQCKSFPSVSNSSLDSCVDHLYLSDRSMNNSNRSMSDVEYFDKTDLSESLQNNDDIHMNSHVDSLSDEVENLRLYSCKSKSICEMDLPMAHSSHLELTIDKKSYNNFLTEDDIPSRLFRKDSSTDVESYDSGYCEPITTVDFPF